MTERLTQQMHAEADRLDVPPPDAASVLARGRRVRGRRRLAAAGSVVAAAVLVGAVVTGTGLIDDEQSTPEPAAPAESSTDIGAAFSTGTTVYLQGGAVTATIDDRAIKTLRFTSVGVLVEHGSNAAVAGQERSGPQRFSLVRPDGDVEPLSLELSGTPIATDIDQDFVAFAEPNERGGYDVVLLDVTIENEVARVPLPPGAVPAGDLAAPNVALSGDTVYVGGASTVYTVHWPTGEVETTDVFAAGDVAAVRGGTLVESTARTSSVVEVQGRVLTTYRNRDQLRGSYLLSPDGSRALEVVDALDGSAPAPRILDFASGDSVPLQDVEGEPTAYHWTADGDLFRVQRDAITTCSGTTGECTSSPLDLGEGWNATLKIGGETYAV